jgi:transcriptional regulator with XRE-family HTH domain
MSRQVLVPEGEDRWRVRARDLLKSSGMTYATIAEDLHVSEKTVSRLFTGEAKNPSMDFVIQVVHSMGYTASDVFTSTDAVIGGKTLKETQASLDTLKSEYDALLAEHGILKEQLNALTASNSALTNEANLLRMQLQHKDEIIAIYKSFNK